MQKNSATVFRGCATALITPFLHGRIDYDSFISMIERNLALGADALVIAGTTGEASTLSPEEQVELYVSEGASKMDAIKRVAKERGVHKNEIYKLFNKD